MTTTVTMKDGPVKEVPTNVRLKMKVQLVYGLIQQRLVVILVAQQYMVHSI